MARLPTAAAPTSHARLHGGRDDAGELVREGLRELGRKSGGTEMPRTNVKPNRKPQGADGPVGEVLTLAEAAAYLRVAKEEVLRTVRERGLPGRQFGDEWRFLRAAIEDWLRAGATTLQQNKDAWMALAGEYKDDPDLQAICDEAYRQRRLSSAGGE